MEKKETPVNEKAKEIKVTVLEGTMDTPAGSIVKFTPCVSDAMVMYRIPSNRIQNWSETKKELGNDDFIKHMDFKGIYFIFFDKDGYEEFKENKDKLKDCYSNAVYIGQAEKNGLVKRLRDGQDKIKVDASNHIFILTMETNKFERDWIDYLEREFIAAVDENKECYLINGDGGHKRSLTHEVKEDMAKIIKFAKTVISISNHYIFKCENEDVVTDSESKDTSAKSPTKEKTADTSSANYVFNREYFLRSKDDDGEKYDATGKYENYQRFVVLKGSKLRMKRGTTIPTYIEELREENEKSGVIENGILKDDIAFTSLSAAAAFVLQRRVSGPDYWKTEDGVSINEMRGKLASR